MYKQEFFFKTQEDEPALVMADMAKIWAQIKTDASSWPLFNVAKRQDDLSLLNDVAGHIRSSFKHLIVFGTGGSSLNGQMLANLKYFVADQFNVIFLDNVDPHRFHAALAPIAFEETAFLCISKSGNTLETQAQFLLLCSMFGRKLGTSYSLGKNIFVITDPGDNPLRTIAAGIKATIIDHDNIGGRFSTLTAVGLLPAMVLGLSAERLRAGACAMIDEHYQADAADCKAVLGAAIHRYQAVLGYDICVTMPYIDRLSCFANWWQQIWAESLGKNGYCTTPIKAMGTIDQHSQLQLYLDGPRDKFFTLITMDSRGVGEKISAHGSNMSLLDGKTLGDVMYAMQETTLQTLLANNLPSRRIDLPKLDEEIMGGLTMHFALETVLMSYFLQVNPFDQPAVEAGKIIAKEMLKSL